MHRTSAFIQHIPVRDNPFSANSILVLGIFSMDHHIHCLVRYMILFIFKQKCFWNLVDA